MKMKQFLVCALLIMALLVPASAFATEGVTRYELSEVGISIDIPDSCVVFTRDFDPKDPRLADYGYTAKELREMMETNYYYLVSYKNDEPAYFVMVDPSNAKGYSSLSDDELAELQKQVKIDYRSSGNTLRSTSVYEHEQSRFLKVSGDLKSGNISLSMLQYRTVYKGRSIVIGMTSYSSSLNLNQTNSLKAVVDSADLNDWSGNFMGSLGYSNIFLLIMGILIVIAIYSLPIAIYRFAVIKAPLEKEKARTITIAYGVCAFLVMSVLLTLSGEGVAGASPVVLWSYVNYHVLIGGKDRRGDAVDVVAGSGYTAPSAAASAPRSFAQMRAPKPTRRSEPAAAPAPVPDGEHNFCHRCGSKLYSDSLFCSRCGAPLPKE